MFSNFLQQKKRGVLFNNTQGRVKVKNPIYPLPIGWGLDGGSQRIYRAQISKLKIGKE
jgi:hypothetical protein